MGGRGYTITPSTEITGLQGKSLTINVCVKTNILVQSKGIFHAAYLIIQQVTLVRGVSQ